MQLFGGKDIDDGERSDITKHTKAGKCLRKFIKRFFSYISYITYLFHYLMGFYQRMGLRKVQ
jgi:hypothetical protein